MRPPLQRRCRRLLACPARHRRRHGDEPGTTLEAAVSGPLVGCLIAGVRRHRPVVV